MTLEFGLYVFIQRELKAVLDWAIQQGLPNDTEAGFWTAWERQISAPLELNGTLTKANEETRKERRLFVDRDAPNEVMPDRLWRNASQPGNTLDKRDEMCVAQSRPGKQPEYLGLDDYECNGAQLHYAVCEVYYEHSYG